MRHDSSSPSGYLPNDTTSGPTRQKLIGHVRLRRIDLAAGNPGKWLGRIFLRNGFNGVLKEIAPNEF
jgi:hypothetical protein